MLALRLSVFLTAYLAFAHAVRQTPFDAAAARSTDASSVRSISLLQTQKKSVRTLVELEASHVNRSIDSMLLNETTSVSELLESHSGGASLKDAILGEWHQIWHTLKHSSPLVYQGLYEPLANMTSAIHSEVAAISTISVQHFIAIFIAVFAFTSLSWMIIAAGNKLHGRAYLKSLKIFVLCFSLSACSWGMAIANKYLMIMFPAPGFVTAVQLILGVVVAILLAGGRLSLESTQVRGWIVVPVFACLQLWSSLYTMKYLTLSTLMVIRNLGPIVTLPIEMVVMPTDKRPIVNCSALVALLLVLASAAMYVGAVPPSWKGCVFALLNMMLAVTDVVLRRRLLSTECAEMSVTMCMLLNNLVGIIPSMLLGFCTGELLDIDLAKVFSSGTIVVLIISGFVGSGIAYFALSVQREMAATSFMVFENGTRIAEVLGGILLFQDPFTRPCQILGLFVSYCGSLWYAKVQIDCSVPTSSKGKSIDKR